MAGMRPLIELLIGLNKNVIVEKSHIICYNVIGKDKRAIILGEPYNNGSFFVHINCRHCCMGKIIAAIIA